MSGDRVLKTPLLTSKISEENIKDGDISKKTAKPTTITITANGHEIQSNLNPNASEFFPSYLQKKPQIVVSEEPELTVTVYDKLVRNKILNVEREFSIEEPINKEDKFARDLQVRPAATICEIPESVDIQKASQDVRNVATEEKNEKVHHKIESNMDRNQLYVLFASSSAVINSSSETVRSIMTVTDIDNSSPDKRNENNNIGLEERNNEEKIQDNVLSTKQILEESLQKVKELEKLRLENFNQNNSPIPEIKANIPESVKDGEGDLIVKPEDEKEAQIVYFFCKDNAEDQNIKRSNETDMEISSIENQHTASREATEPKKKINISSKIARVPKPTTGTANKLPLTKTAQKNTEHEKEIKPKAESTTMQSSNLNRSVKSPSLIPNKPPSKPFKKEVTKVPNKDTASNKPSSSTEKSSASNKPCPSTSSAKPTEKPLSHGQKTKESIPKSPRATVASKLRKAETQKVS